MARELTPTELRDLLGAYSLGAVSDKEHAQVERALLSDPAARAELHALQLGVAWLEHSSERPSDGLWDRIASGMHADAPTPVVPLRSSSTVPLPSPGATPSRARWLAVAAALVVGLAIAGGVGVVTSPGSDLAGSAVALRTADGGVAARAVVLDGGPGIVRSVSMPSLPSDRTYQLWAITAAGPVSLGTMGSDPTAAAFRIDGSASRLAITPEPHGGSERPTGPVVASGALTS